MIGYEQVKPEQWIVAFVSGVDVFVALPTEFGNSFLVCLTLQDMDP